MQQASGSPWNHATLGPAGTGPVAQWIEHPPPKRKVARSSRAGTTRFFGTRARSSNSANFTTQVDSTGGPVFGPEGREDDLEVDSAVARGLQRLHVAFQLRQVLSGKGCWVGSSCQRYFNSLNFRQIVEPLDSLAFLG